MDDLVRRAVWFPSTLLEKPPEEAIYPAGTLPSGGGPYLWTETPPSIIPEVNRAELKRRFENTANLLKEFVLPSTPLLNFTGLEKDSPEARAQVIAELLTLGGPLGRTLTNKAIEGLRYLIVKSGLFDLAQEAAIRNAFKIAGKRADILRLNPNPEKYRTANITAPRKEITSQFRNIMESLFQDIPTSPYVPRRAHDDVLKDVTLELKDEILGRSDLKDILGSMRFNIQDISTILGRLVDSAGSSITEQFPGALVRRPTAYDPIVDYIQSLKSPIRPQDFNLNLQQSPQLLKTAVEEFRQTLPEGLYTPDELLSKYLEWRDVNYPQWITYWDEVLYGKQRVNVADRSKNVLPYGMWDMHTPIAEDPNSYFGTLGIGYTGTSYYSPFARHPSKPQLSSSDTGTMLYKYSDKPKPPIGPDGWIRMTGVYPANEPSYTHLSEVQFDLTKRAEEFKNQLRWLGELLNIYDTQLKELVESPTSKLRNPELVNNLISEAVENKVNNVVVNSLLSDASTIGNLRKLVLDESTTPESLIDDIKGFIQFYRLRINEHNFNKNLLSLVSKYNSLFKKGEITRKDILSDLSKLMAGKVPARVQNLVPSILTPKIPLEKLENPFHREAYLNYVKEQLSKVARIVSMGKLDKVASILVKARKSDKDILGNSLSEFVYKLHRAPGYAKLKLGRAVETSPLEAAETLPKFRERLEQTIEQQKERVRKGLTDAFYKKHYEEVLKRRDNLLGSLAEIREVLAPNGDVIATLDRRINAGLALADKHIASSKRFRQIIINEAIQEAQRQGYNKVGVLGAEGTLLTQRHKGTAKMYATKDEVAESLMHKYPPGKAFEVYQELLNSRKKVPVVDEIFGHGEGNHLMTDEQLISKYRLNTENRLLVTPVGSFVREGEVFRPVNSEMVSKPISLKELLSMLRDPPREGSIAKEFAAILKDCKRERITPPGSAIPIDFYDISKARTANYWGGAPVSKAPTSEPKVVRSVPKQDVDLQSLKELLDTVNTIQKLLNP